MENVNNQLIALSRITPTQQTVSKLPINGKQAEQIKFADILKSALNKVNEVEHESNLKTNALAQGKIDDLHDVMITAQKAAITVETTVQIQQKVIDTYNEMMRMQV